ncbi:MAG: ABC transporter substrate-binding protein [Butyrivibrio sp.]|nr:ABC transporter substrate-binding protein [Butyrivibrio sp.]
MKKKLISAVMSAMMVSALLAGCGSSSSTPATKEEASTATAATQEAAVAASAEGSVEAVTTDSGATITVGFSQVGAESDWRTANTESMKSTFSEANGYSLIFDDAQQKQENQITAIRNFIQQEVDYIVLAPVTETGWDTVLQEAKDAGIPVIIVDRMVNVSDDSLFTAWVGSDFLAEGNKAAEWLNAFATAKGINAKDIHIADIQGTIGASAQIGRSKGLEDAVKKYGWDLVAQQTGEFTQAKGQEVMESLLKQYDNINVVYCENDNEAFGAIDALTAAGKTVGSDIAKGQVMVMSFDSTNAGLTDVLAGKITLDTECNPLHGPRVEEIIKKLQNKETVDHLMYVDEAMFAVDDTVKSVQAQNSVGDTVTYDVTVVTKDVISGRAY